MSTVNFDRQNGIYGRYGSFNVKLHKSSFKISIIRRILITIIIIKSFMYWICAHPIKHCTVQSSAGELQGHNRKKEAGAIF